MTYYHSDGSICGTFKVTGGHHHQDCYPTLVEAADVGLREATARAITAAEDSVKAAVLLLAAGAQEVFPEAKRINLSESDQGEWLWVDGIDGEISFNRHGVEVFDDTYGHAASWLQLAHLQASPALHADLDADGTDNGRYYIDIAETLA